MAVTVTAVDTALYDSSSGTTGTITGVSFGAAFAGRVIAICTNIDGSNTLDACTIGGVSATVIGNSAGNYIAYAVVESGTSGDIVFTFGGTDSMSCACVWAIAGSTGVHTDSDLVAGSNSVTLTVPASGAAIINGFIYLTSSMTWTNATEDSDHNISGSCLSGAHYENPGAQTNRTFSYTSGLYTQTVGLAFEPGGGPPPSNTPYNPWPHRAPVMAQ